ncbi:MAG TPA: HAMP domain-containing histidine kinase [Trueperaceae bacterium]|nr:HAMP domain-containing histidine kinase [Trueperaceae bacterium]
MSNFSYKPVVLIAMSNEKKANQILKLTEKLGLEGAIVTKIESLLYYTRSDIPAALVLEHDLVKDVKINIISLLRRRRHLTDMPIIYLGPNNAELHVAALKIGADIYIDLPTQPSVISANLERLWHNRQIAISLREALANLHKLEKAYRESERIKDDLTHMLVHDLKSPIASVMGLLDHSMELIKDDTSSDIEIIQELLTLARTESQHLLNLAANILDVRRMKEGHMPYSPIELTELSKLAKEAIQDVTGDLSEREFSLLIRPEAEKLRADPELLRRILANLFSNAIKHSRRGGHIDFRAWLQEDNYVLCVRDDGEGIPAQDLGKIFNAFEQSRYTVHSRYDTGMGLTFCKLAVEKHGGKIWVESVVGRGSSFYFTIPLMPEIKTKISMVNEDYALSDKSLSLTHESI